MDWTAIERAAKRQGNLSRKRLEAEVLEVGSYVAWTETGWMGQTEGFSELHRVSRPDEEAPETFCGDLVPPPICRVDLSVWPVGAFHPCRRCANAYAKVAIYGLVRRSA